MFAFPLVHQLSAYNEFRYTNVTVVVFQQCFGNIYGAVPFHHYFELENASQNQKWTKSIQILFLNQIPHTLNLLVNYHWKPDFLVRKCQNTISDSSCFRSTLATEDLSSETLRISHTAENHARFTIKNFPGESGLASLLGNKLIPFHIMHDCY